MESFECTENDAVKPEEPLKITGIENYETVLLDKHTIGVRPKWISVKNRLPKEDENVILFDGNQVFCGSFSYENNDIICWGNQACDGICYGWYEKDEITHWIPLPPPPKEIEE